MTIPGNGFMAIWHDIDPAHWDAYMEWHTREHMPERVSIPGFLTGKRLISHTAPRYRYGTVYTGETAEVFRSPAYLERLNNPTPWTQQVAPAFRNFLRVACEPVARAGTGDGGAMTTIRLDFAEGFGEAALRGAGASLAASLRDITGVCCVTIGAARPHITDVPTRETALRPGMAEKGFDAVILIEGSGVPELDAARTAMLSEIGKADAGLTNPVIVTYALAYQIAEADILD